MRNIWKLAAVLTVALLFVGVATWADESLAPKEYIESQNQRGERIVEFNRTFGGASNGLAPIPLPMPIDPISPFGGSVKISTGAISQVVGTGGSAIVAPRGGAISTPKQQADRAIQQLIHRLY